ncbi:MAG: cobalt ECF transporter T component CbiQ [Candidatus Aminicenantales bacterium]
MISITSEKPGSRRAFLDSLDPRVKFVSFIIFMFVIIFTPFRHYLKFLAYCVMLAVMIITTRISIGEIIKKLLLLFPLLFFLALSVILFGKNQFHHNLDTLWNIFIKSSLSFFTLILLSSTTEFYSLIKGLEQLKIPHIITSLLLFGFRYSSLLKREAERLNMAREARSFEKKRKGQEIKTLSSLIPHLFLRTFLRSERIYAAMLSRGYRGKIQTLSSFKLSKNDFLFISALLSILTVILVVL